MGAQVRGNLLTYGDQTEVGDTVGGGGDVGHDERNASISYSVLVLSTQGEADVQGNVKRESGLELEG